MAKALGGSAMEAFWSGTPVSPHIDCLPTYPRILLPHLRPQGLDTHQSGFLPRGIDRRGAGSKLHRFSGRSVDPRCRRRRHRQLNRVGRRRHRSTTRKRQVIQLLWRHVGSWYRRWPTSRRRLLAECFVAMVILD
jgi:hypothetical protein